MSEIDIIWSKAPVSIGEPGPPKPRKPKRCQLLTLFMKFYNILSFYHIANIIAYIAYIAHPPDHPRQWWHALYHFEATKRRTKLLWEKRFLIVVQHWFMIVKLESSPQTNVFLCNSYGDISSPSRQLIRLCQSDAVPVEPTWANKLQIFKITKKSHRKTFPINAFLPDRGSLLLNS